ncbi:hypothetical protein H7169_01130 [Candidatus Gracilibacteria bacterium]|nr:hypothetical protein [Candidatus Gracilibacteria bacterium]
MPTQLDPTWLPGNEPILDSDILGGVYKTSRVSKKVSEIIEILSERVVQGTCYVFRIKNIKDSHSEIKSDDLLWYIRGGISEDEKKLLENIKMKGNNIVIPRELSGKISTAISLLTGVKQI